MKTFRGKYLIRKAKTSDGTPVVVLCGIFVPLEDIDWEKLQDSDEMWVSDLIVGEGGLRFTEPINKTGAPSPEDFLSGEGTSPRFWGKKENLDEIDLT